MRVCIVIPMHNEELVAERCVRTVRAHVAELSRATTICVVDDGSDDSTPSILDRVICDMKDDGVIVQRHETNRGYGAALRTGIRYAVESGYEFVIFMDSDLTNHPRYLKQFYEKMDEGWDYIKASRYIPGGAVVGVPRKHQFVSRAGNAFARRCYGIPVRDITNGFRAVRVRLLKQMHLREDGFEIILEELTQAKRLGARFYEVPYTLTSRGEREGRSHLSYGPRTIWRYFARAVRGR